MHETKATLLALAVCAGCSPAPTNDAVTFEREAGEPACDGGPAAPSVSVEARLLTLGEAPNEMLQDGGELFIVESFSNTTSRFDTSTQRYDGGLADSGNGRNPYDAAVDGEANELWVTNYLSNTVSVFDSRTGELLEELEDERFANPSGITLTERRAYVTNVDYQLDGFGAGSVAVVDRATRAVQGLIETPDPNPHFAQTLELGGEEIVIVIASGTLDDVSGEPMPGSDGGVMLMEETDDPLAPEQTYHRLERRGVVGTPGRALPAPDGRHLYFASATAPVLFKLDVVAGEWVRGSDDPIELYEAGERALNRATIDDEGIVWVSAFNEDRLYALDTRCDKPLGEPIELGASPEQLEGPLPLEVLRRGGTKEIYYATSLSEVLGRVTLN